MSGERPTDADLVKRIRTEASERIPGSHLHLLLTAAADELDRLRAATIPDGLRAENERLRSALADLIAHGSSTGPGVNQSALALRAKDNARSLLAAAPPTAEPGGRCPTCGSIEPTAKGYDTHGGDASVRWNVCTDAFHARPAEARPADRTDPAHGGTQ